MSNYIEPPVANDYVSFINSENGKQQQQLIFDVIAKHLPTENDRAKILDLGCGEGWLTEKLSEKYDMNGCDISPALIDLAKKQYPGINFTVADFNQPTAFSNEQFDAVIISMAANCIQNPEFAFKEISRILKPGGTVLITIPNPYYAYPVGIWKRGLINFLLRRKPQLKLKPFWQNKKNSPYAWQGRFSSYFYPLSDQINNALKAGLNLEHFEDLYSPEDGREFNLKYQLHRFPIIIFLKFKKV